ncbi:MAG: 50S ribosomal protein L24 [Planctomycetota bacterium]|nr:50S ribosomal protein L24 [Planctomycetota bacterium]
MPRHVVKGDIVMITSGSLKGQTGEVLRVDPKSERVYLKGMNLRTKNVRPNRLNPKGAVITKEAPMHWSKVSPVVDGKPTRVRFETKSDGSKVRVAARGGKVLSTIRKAEGKK